MYKNSDEHKHNVANEVNEVQNTVNSPTKRGGDQKLRSRTGIPSGERIDTIR